MRRLDVPGIRRRLGANVRRIRLAAKLTQVRLRARWARPSPFSEDRDGRHQPTLTSIARVAFGLDVDISVLFKPARPR